jgi:hypothetical protein
MAEDENQEIVTALAKLAEENAGAADDAGAALEWIAGDQGLALVTQERVQNFCWYELPTPSSCGAPRPLACSAGTTSACLPVRCSSHCCWTPARCSSSEVK